jgi:uncharacterized protein
VPMTLVDPPRDPDHPACLVAVALESGGARLNGVAYVPSGPGPHPGVLVLHGLPGYERNLDLAQALRRAGWTSMVVHYRGAWGSRGEFSFAGVLEDSAAALEHLRSSQMRERLRVDPARVALVGHSMGGWASLMTAARNDVVGAVSIAGFNLGAVARRIDADPSYARALQEVFEPQMAPLAGATADRLFAEAVEAGGSWDVCTHAGKFHGRPVLLLAASHDEEVPVDMHHEPLVEALSGAGARLTHRVVDTDHAFSDRRIELAETIASWLGDLAS